ncbi:hypothetical protein ERJ75_001240400 [Trypanosoma vivax]|uniref:Uncharacterized protein n=1 Tax=Trypanosoma vivax (strain Y486) TaxID=1055687 RepID=G0TWL7_TRYVY|nr:hypothetical protein TRVL_03950 [Trypanosoma vivax]KAH8608889.1 hypothetical protein ERJ75_001240400 [Trypanosoma vivax]CCC48355.1 conserved hypothetical protein [Trypanosoma vivax Y486]
MLAKKGEREIDSFLFEKATLKGKFDFSAFGKITNDLLNCYSDRKHGDAVLSSFLKTLYENGTHVSNENFNKLEEALSERVNTILADVRAQDKLRHLKGRKPVFELAEDEEDEDDMEPTMTEEEMLKQEQERMERERLEEERMAAREEERRLNEERLRMRTRQVDTGRIEKLLQEGAVINAEWVKSKGGKQKQGQSQVSVENMRDMELQVASLTKEKERLQLVIELDENELATRIAEAKAECDAAVTQLSMHAPNASAEVSQVSMPHKQLTARIAELKQKISKLTMERNRLSLKLKAEPHPIREELLDVLKLRDESLLKSASH